MVTSQITRFPNQSTPSDLIYRLLTTEVTWHISESLPHDGRKKTNNNCLENTTCSALQTGKSQLVPCETQKCTGRSSACSQQFPSLNQPCRVRGTEGVRLDTAHTRLLCPGTFLVQGGQMQSVTDVAHAQIQPLLSEAQEKRSSQGTPGSHPGSASEGRKAASQALGWG